jgi:hypothetical protein
MLLDAAAMRLGRSALGLAVWCLVPACIGDPGPAGDVTSDVRSCGRTPSTGRCRADTGAAAAPDGGTAVPVEASSAVPSDAGSAVHDAGVVVPTDAGAYPPSTARQLFGSRFEVPVTLDRDGELLSVAALRGLDTFFHGSDVEGFSWPGDVLGVGLGSTALRNISGDHRNTLLEGGGPDGSRALEMRTTAASAGGCQDNLQMYPAGERGNEPIYFRYRLRLQPDLVSTLGPWGWRAIAMFKTGSGYRVELYVYTDRDGRNPRWHVHGDTVDDTGNPVLSTDASGSPCVATGGPRHQYWEANDTDVPIPTDWAEIEIMWDRGDRETGEGGRFWFSVGGQVVFDEHRGLWPTIPDGTPYCGDPARRYLATPIRWLSPIMLYSNGAFPRHQMVDDLEIWDGFPCTSPPCRAAAR